MVFLLVGFLAWPALGKIVIVCADGSPCPGQSIVVTDPDCCSPASCDVPVKDQCIVTTSPAPFRALPQPAPCLEQPALTAILSPASILSPPAAVTTIAVERERAPSGPPTRQAHSPRAPPASD